MSKAPRIAQQLQHLAVSLDQLQLHPRNAREGDVGAIIESLRTFGQLKPIVAQQAAKPPHTVVAGNHQLLAAQQLGWPDMAVAVVPMDDATALRFMVADNRTQELGTTNSEQLAEVLAELAMAELLDGTGFDGDDVDDLLRLVENPPDLAGLAAKYGDGSAAESESFWPRISLRVETDTYSRWNALWNQQEGTDSERLAAIIDQATGE